MPFEELDIQVQHVLLHGSGNQTVEMIYDDGLRSYRTTKPFEGLLPNLTRRYHETDSNWVRDELEKFRAIQPCEGCGGKRLKAESLAVRIDDKDISDISALSIGDAADWFTNFSDSLSDNNLKLLSAF